MVYEKNEHTQKNIAFIDNTYCVAVIANLLSALNLMT